jgi:hypothetical protein
MKSIYVTSDVRIAEEAKRRIERAKKLLSAIEVVNQVDADMSFWLRRIRWRLRFGGTYVSNSWSFRGNPSAEYRAELARRLPGFEVVKYQLEAGELVVVKW